MINVTKFPVTRHIPCKLLIISSTVGQRVNTVVHNRLATEELKKENKAECRLTCVINMTSY